jgi:acetoacetate decarboxylase
MVNYVKNFSLFSRTLQGAPKEPSINNGYMLQNFYRTRKEIVREILPPPLEVPGDPQVYVYHCFWEKPAFGSGYYESAQMVRARHQGREGWYLLAMYVDEDVSLWIGRELFGLPKRMAKVTLERDGNVVRGTTTRHGIKIMTADMQIKEARPHEKLMETWSARWCLNPNVELEFAQLLSLTYRVDDKESYVGEGSVKYETSESDPVQQLEMVEPLTCWFMVHDMYRQPPAKIFDFKAQEFYPYLTARMIA